jgi:hypothetical protein
MERRTSLFLLIIALLSFSLSFAGYGDIQDSLPSQKEREVLLMTNAVRMDPAGFRDKFIPNTQILIPDNYPPVEPLWYNHDLSRAARFHSVEMANTCGMLHESCDGTTFSKRVNSFYKSSSNIGENIATGVATGIGTVIQWIRDDNAQKVPAPDKSSTDGHRKNIMNAKYHELGAGYAYSSSRQWNHFWTQDFGGGATAANYKIPAGCHFSPPGNTSTLLYAANFYDKLGNAPLKASVFIDNTEYAMSLYLGKVSAGTYVYSQTKDTKIHCYYFLFTDASGVITRYPQTMTLSTGDQGTCVDIGIINDHTKRVTKSTSKPATRYYRLNGSELQISDDKFAESKRGRNVLLVRSQKSEVRMKNEEYRCADSVSFSP